ncbi:MAG: DUF3750 domain-containing protein [Planctomycetes bacterium]|nr:DUF3750 domain-containing protein [Planctomycetota bacterium]
MSSTENPAAAARGARRWPRVSLLGGLVLCLAGEGCNALRTHDEALPPAPTELVVQLRCASLPDYLQPVAVHCWFVAADVEKHQWHRWEVWQKANRGGKSWGHVHRDLWNPDKGVGGGPYSLLKEWRGEDAKRLLAALDASTQYPDRNVYHAWPGPNSNTYVAWVLREARVGADLPPTAIGKDWLGFVGAGASTTRTGVQLETPVVGLKLGLEDGVEAHVGCLTLGVDLWPPALKTPFGRLGFAD